MALAPNARTKVVRLVRELTPEFARIAQSLDCTVEVVPPSMSREVELVQFRNNGMRLVLEAVPAMPTWRTWTVFSYAAEANDAAERLGERLRKVQDEDDKLFLQAEVKKQR